MALSNQVPAAPIDMVMPTTALSVYTIITFSLLAVATVLLARESRRSGSWLPLCALLGGAISVLLEPIFDVILLLWYPDKNTTPLFRAFNTSVPHWILPSYALYMGAQGYWMYQQFSNGITAKRLWTLLAIFFCADVLLEAPGLNLGLYIYYGDQPFRFLGFPAWMGAVNAVIPMLVGAAFYGLRDVLTGWRVLLAIPLVPAVVAAAEAANGWPVWYALNADVGLVGTHVAGLVSIVLTLATTYVLSLKLTRPLAAAIPSARLVAARSNTAI